MQIENHKHFNASRLRKKKNQVVDINLNIVLIIYIERLFIAKFIPSDGLFTRTVNAGDTGVMISMVVRNPSDSGSAMIKWRKDGGEEITSLEGFDHYIIQGPVQPSDGGIYEIYYEGERTSGRGGLHRLIVRGILNLP